MAVTREQRDSSHGYVGGELAEDSVQVSLNMLLAKCYREDYELPRLYRHRQALHIAEVAMSESPVLIFTRQSELHCLLLN